MILLFFTPLLFVIGKASMFLLPLLLLFFFLLSRLEQQKAGGIPFTNPFPREAQLLLLLIVAWPLGSAFSAIEPAYATLQSLKLLGLLILGFALLHYAVRISPTASQLRRYRLGFAFTLLCLLLLNIGHGTWLFSIWPGNPDGLVRFLEKDINRGLCLLVLLMFPLLARLSRRRALLLGFLMLIALFGQHSLTAKLGFLSGLFIYTLALRWPAGTLKTLRLAMPALLAAWPIAAHYLTRYFLTSPALSSLPPSGQHRLHIWDFTLQHITQHPIAGWGMGSSRFIPGGMNEYEPYLKLLPMHPHNSVLQLMLEQGGIGLFVTLAALTLVLHKLHILSRGNSVLAALLAGLLTSYLAMGFSGFGLWQTWWIAGGFLAAGLTLWMTPKTLQVKSAA